MSDFTEKQEAFCEEYVKDFNGARAARAAGYSVDTARTIASSLLTKPDIKKRIAELAAKRKERLKVSSDRVIEELAKIALADGAGDMAGFSIELKDKIKALELLGKTAGTFNNDDSGKAIINVTIAGDPE